MGLDMYLYAERQAPGLVVERSAGDDKDGGYVSGYDFSAKDEKAAYRRVGQVQAAA